MKNKYRNIKTTVDNITFDSRKEAKRYLQLKQLTQATDKSNRIYNLELQPKFAIKHNDINICTYIADFAYFVNKNDQMIRIIEDVKGTKTDVYKLKKKLVKAFYNIDILEI